MVAKNLSKQEALRNRVYKFFEENKNLGKSFTVKHFTAEKVPRSTVYDILSRLEDFPAQRKPGSGATIQKMTQRQVKRLKKDFNHTSGMSPRQSARKFNISQQRVCKILQNNGICARKKMRIPSRTEQQKTVARAKCGNLYLKNQGISWVLDDESYFTLSHSTINGNDIFYSSNSAETPASVKYTPLKKFEPKLLVWVCVSEKGISAPIFRQSSMAVNKTVYKGFIKDGVLPFINKHHSDGNYKFWPDLASSHYATEVVEYYRAQKIKFVEKCENPANVPEVRAIEDFWSILKGKVYENGWKAENLTLLKNRIRLYVRKMDPNLVHRLLAGTSARLNNVRNNDLIENRD